MKDTNNNSLCLWKCPFILARWLWLKSKTLLKINQYSIYECTWYGIPKQLGPIINSLFDLKQEQKPKPLLMLNRALCQSKTTFQDLDWYCMNYKCSLWQSVIHGRAFFWSTVTHKDLCQTFRPVLNLKLQPTAKQNNCYATN